MRRTKYACDDVNDMELPIEKGPEARKDDMKYMEGGGQEIRGLQGPWEPSLIRTQWVDADKSNLMGTARCL